MGSSLQVGDVVIARGAASVGIFAKKHRPPLRFHLPARRNSGPALEPAFCSLVFGIPNRGENPMASENYLQELFHDTLKDIYLAETKILSALPKMAKAAHSKDLKASFQKHETQTEEHVARLEKVSAHLR
jgi:hypothetical protein